MTPPKSLEQAISGFGAAATKKLGNRAASGEPEDQLRAPLESLLADLAALCGFAPGAVIAVGESSLSDLKTRPDYAVTVQGALDGFIEVKAPAKGADPRRFRDKHDKEQWVKLQSIPNLDHWLSEYTTDLIDLLHGSRRSWPWSRSRRRFSRTSAVVPK